MKCKLLKSLFLLSVMSGFASFSSAFAVTQTHYSDRKDVREYIEKIANKNQFNKAELLGLFKRVQRQQSVLDAISKPAERVLTWQDYRPIFIKPTRIEGGIAFWREHADILAKAEKEYGVPAEIIVAIIGVETRYGKYIGKHPVFDSLVTLSFDWPRRQKFFRSELEQFLLLAKAEQLDVFKVKGSYAGAVGMPQFISSSYRSYAVDFDGDGKRDLWNSVADVVGSVANYFAKHGWKQDAAVVSRAIVTKDVSDLAVGKSRKGLKPKLTVAQFAEHGVTVSDKFPTDALATLIELEGKSTEYWLGLKNFYVITRYNHSAMYALAVYQLSRYIKEGYTKAPNIQSISKN